MLGNNQQVIILGAGGHAKVVADALSRTDYKVIGLISPDKEKGSLCFGVEVLGDDNVLDFYSNKEVLLANGIGSLSGTSPRWNMALKMRDKGFVFVSVIHPSAVIAHDVVLAEGVQIMAGAIVQPGVYIGQDTIINTASSVDHDCYIGANCHLSPGVILSGSVRIQGGTHVGTGCIVINNISIGSNCLIAAGAVVFKDVSDGHILIQKKMSVVERI